MRKTISPLHRTAAILLAVLLATGIAGCRRKTPDDLMQEAIQAAQSGDILGAQMKCEKVIEKWPDDPVSLQSRLVLATLNAQERNVEQAREYWREIIDRVGVTEEVGQQAYQSLIVNIAQEEGTGFEAAIQEILATSSTLAAAPAFARQFQTVVLADLYAETEQYDKAREVLKKAKATMQDPGEALDLAQRMAGLESQAGEPMAAAEVWQSYLDEHPDSPERAGILARIASYWRSGADASEDERESSLRDAKADELLAESIALFQEEIEGLDQRIADAETTATGQLSLDDMLSSPPLAPAGEDGFAFPTMSDAESLRAEQEGLRMQLVQILMWDGRFEEAKDVRQRQIDRADSDSGKIRGILGKAVVMHTGGESEPALQLLEEAYEKYQEAPEASIILTHIAEINYLTDNLDKAREVYTEIAQRFANTRDGQRALEAIRLVQERIEEKNREAALAADGLTTGAAVSTTDTLLLEDAPSTTVE